jgi:hypothetical protein
MKKNLLSEFFFDFRFKKIIILLYIMLYHVDVFFASTYFNDIQSSKIVASSLNHLQTDHLKLQKIIMDLENSNDRLGGRDLVLLIPTIYWVHF